MTHACNAICEEYRVTRPASGRRYGSGQKQYKACSIFVKWEGTFCPCCGYKLRTMPRHTEDREELRMIRVTSRNTKKSSSNY